MKVLVTGGAGCIGSHVADAFLARGDEVWIVDDLSSGKESNVPEAAHIVRMEADVVQLADALMEGAGKRVKLTHAPARPGELRNSLLETARLRQRGWAPAAPLRDGLAQTYLHITAGALAT